MIGSHLPDLSKTQRQLDFNGLHPPRERCPPAKSEAESRPPVASTACVAGPGVLPQERLVGGDGIEPPTSCV